MARPEERDFAGFRIVRPLALGELASVWEAEDAETGEVVAIETLAGDATRDEDVREWFTEAWELVADLDAPGIVTVASIGEQDGVPFAVRKPAGETTLSGRLEAGAPVTAITAAAAVEAVGGALEAAHEAGVIHGALEPSCVVLDRRPADADADAEPEAPGVYLSGFGRAEGDRREDIRDLGALLATMLPDSDEADAVGAPPDPAEAPRILALREVASAASADAYDSAAQVVEAARGAVSERGPQGGGGGGHHHMLVAAISILAVALVVVLLVSGDDGGDADSGSTAAQATATASGSQTAETPPAETTGPSGPVGVRGFPVSVSAQDGSVYAVTRDGNSLDGFDEATGERVLGPVDLQGGEAQDVTVVDGAAWVTMGGEGTLERIDLAAEHPVPVSIGAGKAPGPVIGAGGRIWVVDQEGKQLLSFPPVLTEATKPEATDLEAEAPAAIAYGNGSLWISDASGKVVRVDPRDPSKQKAFEVGGQPGSLLVIDDDVWIADAPDAAVIRLDPATGKTQSIKVGGEPRDLAADPQHLWIANADGYATSIALEGGDAEQVDLSGAGGSPLSIAVGQQVWVATGSGNTLVAIAAASG